MWTGQRLLLRCKDRTRCWTPVMRLFPVGKTGG